MEDRQERLGGRARRDIISFFQTLDETPLSDYPSPEIISGKVQALEEIIPTLTSDKWRKGYEDAVYWLHMGLAPSRRIPLSLEDVSRKVKFHPSASLAKACFENALERLVEDPLVQRKIVFGKKLEDPNDTAGIVPHIARISSWFIETYTNIENEEVRSGLEYILDTYLNVRSRAFGFSQELEARQNKGDYVLKGRKLKRIKKYVEENLLSQHHEYGYSSVTAHSHEVKGFFAGSRTEKTFSQTPQYFYEDTIRPIDKKFLEEFLKTTS